MNDHPQYIKTFRDLLTPILAVLLGFLVLNGCSAGMRLRNLANVPVPVSELSALDTLKIAPEVIRYTGSGESRHRTFTKDIRIQGNHAVRPLWQSDQVGILSVGNGATVHILDFNFDGAASRNSPIRIDSGLVILEHCDFFNGKEWMITIGPAGALELRDSQFRDLGRGAIQLKGGRARIQHSRFVDAGETAIFAESGQLVEAHQVGVFNSLSTGIELHQVAEVWLDTLIVGNSFKNGVLLEDCSYSFLSEVNLRENGQHGLQLLDSRIVGLLGLRSLGNLMNGLDLTGVDSLRIVGSEFVGNGNLGAEITDTDHIRMANAHFGHNAVTGLILKGGSDLLIENSRFQGNHTYGARIDSMQSISILGSQVINNEIGLSLNAFTDLTIHQNLLVSNKAVALEAREGSLAGFRHNLVRENGTGLLAQAILNVRLDSCRIEANELGSDFRSISQLATHDNLWNANQSASYFSNMGIIDSERDHWEKNQKSGVEVLSAELWNLQDGEFIGNHNSLLFNQGAIRMSSCSFDSGTGTALQAMNAKLFLAETNFRDNNTAILLREGSRCDLVQSKFRTNDEILFSEGATEVFISYSDMEAARSGVTVGEFGKLEVISSRFAEIDGYCIEGKDANIQSIFMRQNLIHHSGGALKLKIAAAKVEIVNNTFADLLNGFELGGGKLARFDQNILWNTNTDPERLGKLSTYIRWNCFYPQSQPMTDSKLHQANLFLDPLFSSDYYLSARSPCLMGGENGSLIGARGINPVSPPRLQP